MVLEAGMIRSAVLASISALALTSPALAQETPENKREFFLQCRPCHSVTTPEGKVIMRGSGLGSDLYGIIDRPAAIEEGFAYSNSMLQAAEMGLVWTVENILEYSKDPRKFLRAYTGDPKAEGTMIYKLVKGQDLLIAYLEAVGPLPEEGEPGAKATPDPL
jgi:cytochrome c